MYGNGYANTYNSNQVSTASKTKLILLMYDGAIRFIKEAISKTRSKDIAGYGLKISKAQRIVVELENSLDKRQGGQVAVNLQKTYSQVSNLLTAANISGDEAPLSAAANILTSLREAWEQVINGPESAQTSSSQAPAVSNKLTINA